MNNESSEHVSPAPAEASTLQISDLATDARGVGHIDGKAVFVADALPGEKIRYLPLRQHRSYDEGKLAEILEPAALRVSPPCPHFGTCGGCALQHLAAPGQIEFKQSQLINNLQRIGKVSPQRLLAPVTGPQWQYRRRARLAVKYDSATDSVVLGFRDRSGTGVANLQSCAVLIAEVGERLVELQRLLGQLSIKDQLSQLEVAGGDHAVGLILRVQRAPTGSDRAQLERFSRDTGLWFYLQMGASKSLTPLRENTPELMYALPKFDLKIGFEPSDFIQINSVVNQKMIEQALTLLALKPSDHALDLFAGVGNFSLPMARRVNQVTSVEGDKRLVARTVANAVRNGVDNCFAVRQDLFSPKPGTAWAKAKFNKVLLDPPRAGARNILSDLAAKSPTHIVYCSCHPATLARDAGILVREHGYTLAAAGVIDMFPHTAHVEAMALFVRP